MASKSQIKKIQKRHPWSFLIVVFAFVLAFVGGYFTCKTLTKNDVFEINGEKTIILTIGSQYDDEGARAIAFGKDISSEIKTEDNVEYDKVGDYYIKYYVDNILYRNVYRYRYIKIVEVNDAQ